MNEWTLLLVIICLVCAVDGAAHAQPSVSNPSFEVLDTVHPDRPKDWQVVGSEGLIAIDRSEKHSGQQSVRIERKDQFTGLGQTVDATPWRGKAAVVRAWFKSRNIGAGTAGVWFRGDKNGARTFFTQSYANPIDGQGNWVMREALTLVPTDTERLVFGVAMGASGTLWADSVELSEYITTSTPALSEQARAYLDSAVEKIRGNALNTEIPDWNKLTPLLYAMADGSILTSDTYGAINLALSALRDGHSHFRRPEAVRQLGENAATDNFALRSQLIANIAYVSIPGYAGGQISRNKAFTDEIQRRLNTMAEAKPCGWIVDLRANTGGNMWPMIAGLAPLLGDGELGSFVTKASKVPWRGSGGVSPDAGATTSDRIIIGGETAPVAVLIGPRTSSSGEATLVSFIGRPNTRTFGEPTAGLSTANQGFQLSDGALMLVTTSTFADRNGKVYGGKIDPDELVNAPADSDLDKDAAVRTAMTWLRSGAECVRSQR